MMENNLEKDEYGLFIDAPNYHYIRQEMDARRQFVDHEKLNRIPKWIRWIFDAL